MAQVLENEDGAPVTKSRIVEDLIELGVSPGMTVVVHSSLRSIGWVVGGAVSVVEALVEVLGDSGNLVMPSATPLSGDPRTWPGPTAPEGWHDWIRDHLPLFDPRVTPTTMGAIAECFRTWPGTLRSDHPLESVCARGPMAAHIVSEHPLAFSEGPGSPFSKVHDDAGNILLIGVGFNRCTALHFAESLSPKRRTMTSNVLVMEKGKRTWRETQNVADDLDTLFPEIGDVFLKRGLARQGSIGEARGLLFEMRDLVEVAIQQFDSRL